MAKKEKVEKPEVIYYREFKPGRTLPASMNNKVYIKKYATKELAKQDQNQRLLPEIHESKILS